MNEFFERNKAFLLSFSYLMAALLVAGYSVFYTNLQVGISDLQQASKSVGDEVKGLQARSDQEKIREKKVAKGIDSLPTFLKSINEVARQNEVVIRRLTPDPNDPLKFSIEILVDYYTFLRFTLALESRDVVINDMQVRPYDAASVPPIHFISFSITAHNDARENKSERIHELDARVKAADKRNPFQRFAFDRSRKQVKREIDLTWVLKLTGIGRDGSGERYATIDREDRGPGDMVGDKKVVKVESDRVYLGRQTGDGGTDRFVLKFRDTKK